MASLRNLEIGCVLRTAGSFPYWKFDIIIYTIQKWYASLLLQVVWTKKQIFFCAILKNKIALHMYKQAYKLLHDWVYSKIICEKRKYYKGSLNLKKKEICTQRHFCFCPNKREFRITICRIMIISLLITILFNKPTCIYWVAQNLPQICTASAYVFRKSILKQMQYRYAVNFRTLSIIRERNKK